MCLTINHAQEGPWNNRDYRWKVFYKRGGELYSAYTRDPVVDGWKKAKYNKSYGLDFHSYDSQFGFHVFCSRSAARAEARILNGKSIHFVVRKVLVKGHLKSGDYFVRGVHEQCETWGQMKVIN